MSVSIVVPQLGESVAEGTVSKWLKAVGDRVRKEEPLVEIQTDKINVEIPSPAEGTLQSIVIPEGTTVLVGTEIGVLAASGEAAGAPATTAKPAAAASAPAASAATQGDGAERAAPAGGTAAASSGGARPGTPPRAPAVAPVPVGAISGSGNGADLESHRNLSPAVRKIMR